ncbi:hypothetical protein [Halarsenatibacter silvermanii]|uniref:Uncharacterized protein n=1 Tax=Halarsenatibacter silvermanii TaxID=321763 RepID=A0A1G9SKM5_9FIRM|nr:hypothetical protein [Halarsenatibacter silvermanii]SDM35979.1 hypothetical protein SAMN04488692_12929 [Halarsenatibacter silvermanii]
MTGRSYFFPILIVLAVITLGTVIKADAANIDKEMSNMNIKTATFAMG